MERSEQIREKWTVSSSQSANGHGNLASHLAWIDGQPQWIAMDEIRKYSVVDRGIGNVLSSADLLYRLACTFDLNANLTGQSAYQTVWSIDLVHRESRNVVTFADYKAHATFWTEFDHPGGDEPAHADNGFGLSAPAPAWFLDDLLEFVEFLCDGCEHPYLVKG